MLRAQWIKAARSQGWREAKSDSGLLTMRCSVQGCPGHITVPLGNLGPVPDPCHLDHEGQYAARVYQAYSDLVHEMIRRRKALGVSQEDVGAAAGLADGHVAKLEAGHRIAQFPTLQLWAATLGFDVALLPAPLPPAMQRTICARPHQLRETSHAIETQDARSAARSLRPPQQAAFALPTPHKQRQEPEQ